MAQVESKNRATSDPAARKRVLAAIKETGIDDMLLWFTDLEGQLKSFSITIGEVESALDDGMGFDGSAVTGFNAFECWQYATPTVTTVHSPAYELGQSGGALMLDRLQHGTFPRRDTVHRLSLLAGESA